jgi:hypothetical protein
MGIGRKEHNSTWDKLIAHLQGQDVYTRKKTPFEAVCRTSKNKQTKPLPSLLSMGQHGIS